MTSRAVGRRRGPNSRHPGKLSVASVVTVTTVGVLPVFLTGGVSVQMRADLGFSTAALGAAATIFFGASAAGSAVLGRLAESAGSHRSMRLAAWASLVALAGIAVFARSWGVLVSFLVLGGLANALAQPASNALIIERVRPGRQGLAFGIKQSAIPAATLLGGVAVPLVALTVGWRWAFVVGGGAALLTAVVLPGGGPRRRGHAPRERVPVGSGFPLVLLAVGGGLGSAASKALGAFVKSSGVAAGNGTRAAGMLQAGESEVGLAVRMGGGWLADRTSFRPLAGVEAMLAGGAAGLLLMSRGTVAAFVPGTLIAFGSGWSWPGLFNLAVARDHPHAPAAATGITQTGVYAGGALGPLLFGVVAERWSYGTAWATAAVLGVTAAATVFLARRLLVAPGVRPGGGVSLPGT